MPARLARDPREPRQTTDAGSDLSIGYVDTDAERTKVLLTEFVNSQTSGLNLTDSEKNLLMERAGDLNVLANSNILKNVLKTMTDVSGTSVEQLATILSAGNPKEVANVVAAFKRVHEALDTVLDEKLGISVSETLRFQRAITSAASARGIDGDTKPQGPFGNGPSDLITSVSAKIPASVGFGDVLGPGFVEALRQEVADGNLTQDAADAILIVYSSRLLSALGVKALASKDMQEAEMTATIEQAKPTDKELAQAVWALKTLQKMADQQLESPEKPGISATEMMALRAAVYAFEAREEDEGGEGNSTISQQNKASASASSNSRFSVTQSSVDRPSEEEKKDSEDSSSTGYPIWVQALVALGVLFVIFAIVFGLVKAFSGSSGQTPKQAPQYGSIPPQQQQQQPQMVQNLA